MSQVIELLGLVRHTVSADGFPLSVLVGSGNPKHDALLQLSASMSALEDTELAIDSFFRRWLTLDLDDQETAGERYLLLYGVMHAFFLQQDAARHMLEVAGLGLDSLSELERDGWALIRRIRTEAVAHPTKLDNRWLPGHTFIDRASITAASFEYFHYAHGVGDEPDVVRVDLGSLRLRQAAAISTALGEIDEQLIALAEEYESDWPA